MHRRSENPVVVFQPTYLFLMELNKFLVETENYELHQTGLENKKSNIAKKLPAKSETIIEVYLDEKM